MIFYREEYCFVPWRLALDGEGYEPALPKEVYREMLADLGRSQDYGAIYMVRLSEDAPEPPNIRVIAGPLKKLLMSGRAYPPAIAIARDVRFQKEAENWSEPEAIGRFTEALRTELDHQRDRRFFLAEAIGANSGYKQAGQYYWIVGYRPSRRGREVSWVSDDFFVYQDPVTDFEVSVSYLCERFGVSQTGESPGTEFRALEIPVWEASPTVQGTEE